ncbi:hypothetical protein KR059_012589, partial [Drosophila kikkawai]
IVTRSGDSQLSGLGSCVKKVRRTTNGNLLLEMAKESAESAESMRTCIAQVLGDSAEVRAMSEDSNVAVLEIRELDALTREPELVAAIAEQYSLDKAKVKVRSIRPGYAESQTAVISLPCSLAKAVLRRGKLRIGWSSCSIRERTGPPRCYRSADGFVRGRAGRVWVYSCYLAPSLTLEAFSSIMDALSDDIRGRSNSIVGGDFNAWAQDWGSPSTNARGRTILEAFASLDIALLNEGTQQTFNRAGAGSIIDLTYASSALACQARWRISE